jgi:predicted ATPase
VCRRLDGIPLAIELAAARVRALPVEEIAARLDQRFRLLTGGSRVALPRHQTLAALVGWSYDLLSEPERVVFTRLSVFAGSFSLEAAERVAGGDGIAETDVVDLVARLVERSLVQAEEGGRYRLLETLRQYGGERLLARGGVEATKRQHAAYFAGLVMRLSETLQGPDPVLTRLDQDMDNLRAALRWASGTGNAATVLRLLRGRDAPAEVRAAGRFWYVRGHMAEWQAWVDVLLAMPAAAAAPPPLKAELLFLA